MKLLQKIALLFLFILFAMQFSGQELLIKGKYKGNLPKILKKLRNEHQLKFAFNYSALKEHKVDLELFNETVENTIPILLEGTGFTFKYIDETIVIYDQEQFQTSEEFSMQGKILDLITNETLPFANVYLLNESIGTTSNEDGLFLLKNVKDRQDTLVVSFLGYSIYKKSLENFISGSFSEIMLEPINQFLPTVQIISEKPLSITNDRDKGAYKINPSKISELPFVGAPDVIRSLQALPGVNSGNETLAELNIRGGRSDENLFLLDGFKLYYLDHFFGIYSTLNPDIIKSMRIYKGGFDASFGGRVSGVVDLQGKEGNKNRTSTSFTLNLSSFNALIETPVFSEKLTFIAAIRRAHSDIYQNPLYTKLFNRAFETNANSKNEGINFEGNEIPDFKFYDFYTKLSFRPDEENRFSLTFYRGQDDFEISDETERNFNFTLERDINDYDLDWGNIGLGAIWTRSWSENIYSKFTFGKSSFNRNHHRQLTLKDEDLISETITSRVYSYSERSTLEDLSISSEVNIERIRGENLKIGTETTVLDIVGANNVQDTLPGSNLFYDINGVSSSIYASFEKELKDFSFELGNRTTYYSETNNVYWSPRLRISKKLDEDFSIHMNAGKYYQFIRRTNRQNIYLNQPERWFLANKDSIPVLSIDHISGGITYNNIEWNVDFEGFIKNGTGNILNRNDFLLLDLETQSNSIAQGFSNIGGLEVFIQKLKGKHTGWLGISLSQALEFYDQEGNSINDGQAIFSPDNRTYDIKTAYQFNLPNWQFSSSFYWNSGSHYTPLLGVIEVEGPSGQTFIKAEYAEEFSATLKDYMSLNLSCNFMKNYSWTNLTLGVSVGNVLNRKNVRSRNYIPIFEERGELVDVENRDVQLLGITPSLNVKFTF